MGRYSVSRVNTYLENPFKHWCKYIAKYKPKYDNEKNKYMDRGTVFHKAMELFSESKGNISKLEVVQKIKSIEEYKKFSTFAFESADVAIDRYLENYGNEPFKNVIHTEYKLEYTLPSGNEFIGFIDAIVQNPSGSVTLVDYKTYSSSPQLDKMKYMLQAHMYMSIATKLGFKVRGFRFDCVNPGLKIRGNAYKNKRIEFRYNENTADHFFEEFDRITQIIEANPDFKMYVRGEYMPDAYDYLFSVYVGDVTEDLDEFLANNFEAREEDEEDYE